MNHGSRFSLRWLGVLALALVSQVALVSAAEPAAPAATAPTYTDEQKALLKALDSELGRLDALIVKIDDARYAEFVKGQLQGLKARRDAMLKAPFDSGKYDELRYDLNVEIQRTTQWMAPPLAPPPAKK